MRRRGAIGAIVCSTAPCPAGVAAAAPCRTSGGSGVTINGSLSSNTRRRRRAFCNWPLPPRRPTSLTISAS